MTVWMHDDALKCLDLQREGSQETKESVSYIDKWTAVTCYKNRLDRQA